MSNEGWIINKINCYFNLVIPTHYKTYRKGPPPSLERERAFSGDHIVRDKDRSSSPKNGKAKPDIQNDKIKGSLRLSPIAN
jgi:hypothetical protein